MATRVSGRGLSDLNGGLAGSQPGKGPGDLRFEEFYTAYARRVRALARRRLGDPQQAEDAVQETFLHAFRGLRGLDPMRPAWPWLARIATNVCVDMLRHRQVHPDHNCLDLDDFTNVVPARGVDPAARCIAAEDRQAIVTALGAVCQRQRRVLMLREVEGWRYEDIAVLEGMTLDALKGALKRARQSFREAYAAVVEAGGGLVAALSPRRFWRWLRLRARDATNRFTEAFGSFVGWSAVPLGQVSGLLTAATVTLAAVVVMASHQAPPPAKPSIGTPQVILGDSIISQGGSSTSAGAATHRTIAVGVAPVPSLPTVGAVASAERWRAPNSSRGYVVIGARLPVTGPVGQALRYRIPCESTRIPYEAVCDLIDSAP